MIDKDSKGRFTAGNCGGPGRKKGTQHTAEFRRMIASDLAEIVQVVVDAAKGGDLTACRIVLDRAFPLPTAASEALQVQIDDLANRIEAMVMGRVA